MRPFFLAFLMRCLSKWLSSMKPPLAWKFLVMWLHSDILFAKCSTLNIWHCCEYACLDSCSVTCTVTSSYVLHQTHGEFWHIQFIQIYTGRFKHIQHFHNIFKHTEELLRHIQAYSGLFTTHAFQSQKSLLRYYSAIF